MIAAALQLTRNIRLGTGVNCLPNHNPAVLAHRIAQLDQMAKGRFNWGIGTGGFPGDFVLFDYTPEGGQNRQITREAVDLVLQIWEAARRGDGAGLASETDRWKFTLPERADWGLWTHMVPYQQPHPPIAVAGLSAKSDTLVMAGERGWIPMSINIVTAPTLRAHWETYAASAERAGRVPDRATWRIARDVYVGETPEQARRDVLEGVVGRDWRDYFLPLLTKSKLLIAPKLDPAMPDEDVTLEYLCEHIWIVGDAAEVTEKLRRLSDEVGGFGTLLVIGHEWTPREQWLNSMHRLVEEVMPRLQESPPAA